MPRPAGTSAQRQIAVYAAISRGADGASTLGGRKSCGTCGGGTCADVPAGRGRAG